jgi:hypothetical protein
MIGFVYRIEDILGLDIHYIGSTMIGLKERFINHKSKTSSSIYPFFKEYGIENFKIELLGQYNIENIEMLRQWEQYHIENNGDCVNKISATYLNYKNITDSKILHKERFYRYCEICEYTIYIGGSKDSDWAHAKTQIHKDNCIKKNIPIDKKEHKYYKYCEICKYDVHTGLKDLNYTHTKTLRHNRNAMALEDFDIN